MANPSAAQHQAQMALMQAQQLALQAQAAAPAAPAALLSLSIPFHLYLLINYVGLERHRPRFMFLTTSLNHTIKV